MEGVALTQRGHGWQLFIDEIDELCTEGRKLINAGIMEWSDSGPPAVKKVIDHRGMKITWDYRRITESGNAIICDHCRTRNHNIA